MSKDPLKSPNLYINRELSWLEFNQRVLEEGLDPELPLLERLKFLAIVNSNLDEFFLVRVAWLTQYQTAAGRRRDISGMTPAEQLRAVAARVQHMVAQQAAGVRDVFALLAEHGLNIWERRHWTEEHRQFAKSYFSREIQPLLTPLAIEELDPAPLLPNLQLHVAALLKTPGERPTSDDATDANYEPAEDANNTAGQASSGAPANIGTASDENVFYERVIVVPVPSQLPRWVELPSDSETHLARVDDVIADNVGTMYPGSEVLDTASFRVTRDADVVLQDDEEIDDLLHAMEEVVLSRRRRNAVRLTISAGPDPKLRSRLADWLMLSEEQVYEIDGPQEAAALMALVERPGFDELKIEEWPPQVPRDLIGAEDLWQAVQDHDVLLFHPYESFDPVVKLVEQAAEDPEVLAIKQTLYRTSGDSPMVRALARAAARRQRSHGAGRVESPLRRMAERQLGPAAGGRRRARHLRRGRFQDPRQGPADRPPPARAHRTATCIWPRATTTTAPRGSIPTSA